VHSGGVGSVDTKAVNAVGRQQFPRNCLRHTED
jgi:hypothetical protein